MSFWNGERIKQVRKVLELTQAELAQALGTRQQTISEWELGLYPPGRAYQKVLGYTVERLFEKRGIKNDGELFVSNEKQKGSAAGAGIF